jgi:raffinose/stachyose/melibiose transport system substrate-binding protein
LRLGYKKTEVGGKIMKKVVFITLAMSLFFTQFIFSGGNGEVAKSESAGEQVIELPFLFTNAGNDSQYDLNVFFFDTFNEMYKGEYEIVVEWLPGMAEDKRAKLKMLNASNDLPALVTDLGAEPAFGDLLINNNRLLNIKPYFDSDAEWKRVALPKSIEYNTTSDGKMYTAPATTASYIGMFYNKEHFAEVGYNEFPKTWDEFWEACDALEKAGHTPISLHTTETGWCPNLIATSYLGLSDAGMDFINQKYPTNFNVPVFVESMEILKRLFSYSTSDAVGGKYALAANNFCAGNTSMIPNGPWMIASLSDPDYSPEGFEQKVGYAPYPGGVMLSDQGESYGDAVSMDHPSEVQEGVIKWLKYMATEEAIRKRGVVQGAFSQIVPLTDEDLSQLSPAMQEFSKAINKSEITVPVFQNKWDPITQNEIIPAEMPSLVTGMITVEEYVNKMSEGGKRFAEENNG